jgi:hypothetical protein
MSKIFKNLRKNFIEEGEFVRYLKYAFGEIILTILGILLALQVHVWTQKRSDTNDVKTIIGNLQNEFVQNKQNLTTALNELETSLKNAKFVIGLVGQSESELRQYNLDSLLAASIRYKEFNPSQDVISVLLSSGKLKLIKDDPMRNALYAWASNEVTRNNVSDDLANSLSKFITYLTQNYSLKDFDYYTSERLLGRSNLKIDKFAIFQDIVFENHLDNAIYHLHSYSEVLKETSRIIDEILKHSKKYE